MSCDYRKEEKKARILLEKKLQRELAAYNFTFLPNHWSFMKNIQRPREKLERVSQYPLIASENEFFLASKSLKKRRNKRKNRLPLSKIMNSERMTEAPSTTYGSNRQRRRLGRLVKQSRSVDREHQLMLRNKFGLRLGNSFDIGGGSFRSGVHYGYKSRLGRLKSRIENPVKIDSVDEIRLDGFGVKAREEAERKIEVERDRIRAEEEEKERILKDKLALKDTVNNDFVLENGRILGITTLDKDWKYKDKTKNKEINFYIKNLEAVKVRNKERPFKIVLKVKSSSPSDTSLPKKASKFNKSEFNRSQDLDETLDLMESSLKSLESIKDPEKLYGKRRKKKLELILTNYKKFQNRNFYQKSKYDRLFGRGKRLLKKRSKWIPRKSKSFRIDRGKERKTKKAGPGRFYFDSNSIILRGD